MKYSKYNLLVPNKDDDQYFLFNTFSGSCFEIDSNMAEKVKNQNLDSLNEEVRELFSSAGIVIPNDMNEDNIFSYIYSSHKHSTQHIGTTVLLTWNCNLKCVYCFQDHDKRIETMNKDYADKYIKFLKNSAKQKNAKSLSITLFGGEPLVNIDIGLYILEEVKTFCEDNNMKFSCSMITNGTLLNKELIELLSFYDCNSIQITLDGVKEIHDSRRIYKNGNGSFDATINSLNLLKEKDDINTIIRINIDKININHTYALLDYIGINGINLTNCQVDFGIVKADSSTCAGYASNCFIENEIGDVLYDLWNYAEKQGFKCNISPVRRFMYCGLYKDNQYTIAPNCDVYKCWEHVGMPEHLMGKLNDTGSLVDITYAFYDWMSVDPLKIDACKECTYLPNCGGGCGAVSYKKTGSYHSEGCFKIKGTIEKQVIKYVEELMKKQNNDKNETDEDQITQPA